MVSLSCGRESWCGDRQFSQCLHLQTASRRIDCMARFPLPLVRSLNRVLRQYSSVELFVAWWTLPGLSRANFDTVPPRRSHQCPRLSHHSMVLRSNLDGCPLCSVVFGVGRGDGNGPQP